MFGLSDRLQAIYDQIPKCNVFCDCGCDHGKIIVKAVQEGKCERGVAIDISKPSLQKSKTLAEEYGVDSKIEFICADGLQSVKQTCDVVAICGMGAAEIIKIISNAKIQPEYYLLLPHNYPYRLRRFLLENGFRPEFDKVIKDGEKYYHLIMVTKKATDSFDSSAIYVGKDNRLDNVDFISYLNYRITQLSKIVKYNDDKELNEEYKILTNIQRGLK